MSADARRGHFERDDHDRDAFLRLIASLLDSYKPKGVLMYLMSENRRFGGRSPRDLVDAGEWETLLAEADRLAGGGAS